MRLLKATKEKIVEALLSRKFDPIQKELAAENIAIGDLIYRERVSVELEKALAAAEKIHSGAVNSTSAVQARAASSEANILWYLSERRFIPVSNFNYGTVSNTEITARMVAYSASNRRYNSNRSEDSVAAWAVLNRCSTFAQLEEVWPDIMPIVQELMPSKTTVANLPMVPVSQLNALFDLPVTEAA